MISFISSLEILMSLYAKLSLKEAKLSPKENYQIQKNFYESVADAATVNPNNTKTLLASGLSIFFIKGNPVFSNSPKSQPKINSYCPIFYKWVLDNFVLAKKAFAKAFRSFETCVLVNNNLSRKLL